MSAKPAASFRFHTNDERAHVVDYLVEAGRGELVCYDRSGNVTARHAVAPDAARPVAGRPFSVRLNAGGEHRTARIVEVLRVVDRR